MQASCWTAEVELGFKTGERAALELVYRSYADTVTRAVSGLACKLRITGVPRRWLIADVVQETFTRAFARDSRARFDPARDYAAYLRTIARSALYDQLRETVKYRTCDPQELTFVMDQVASNRPHDRIGNHVLIAIADEYVSSLPEDIRALYELLYRQGVSQRDTATRLGVGRQHVRTCAAKIQSGLRQFIESVDLIDSSLARALASATVSRP